MTIELNGTIKQINETKVVSDKFSQREFILVIDEDSKYPQAISVMANNEAIHKLDSVAVGQKVKAVVNVNGREWVKDGVSKYFNTLTLFKVEIFGVAKSNDEPF